MAGLLCRHICVLNILLALVFYKMHTTMLIGLLTELKCLKCERRRHSMAKEWNLSRICLDSLTFAYFIISDSQKLHDYIVHTVFSRRSSRIPAMVHNSHLLYCRIHVLNDGNKFRHHITEAKTTDTTTSNRQ